MLGVYDAVVFDFDGLILDTESSAFHAWTAVYRHHGVEPFGIDEWAVNLGRHAEDGVRFDPLARLLADAPHLDPAGVHAHRRALRDEQLAAEQVRSGVQRWLDAADATGVAVAIAASSPIEWIEQHLDAHGLRHRFAHIVCAGGVLAGKPDPAVYVEACRRLGVAPRDALALEDSPNGVAAAKAAGMACLAVPCAVTASLDLSAADLVVASLDAIDPRPHLRVR
jgi:putative hydrolase of the HAD superfamily